MKLHLYNTASKHTEPLDQPLVRYYCCGPTVYGPTHIGNFRTFLLQDVLRRVLELEGMQVLHVRNITDVDDKTIRGANAEGTTLEAFTQKWTQHFHEDCKKLGLLQPHHEPCAAAHIPEQIVIIQKLLEKGLAYVSAEGSVYFRVTAFKGYGKLSGLDTRTLETQSTTSAQAPNQADEYDRDSVADFALWKAYKEADGAVGWESPWGRGRPGWHIECSAMSMKYLGETLDLHAGGVDLCFPHHENEIAQSEGATGTLFSQKWFHTAHLQVEGQKMSKSLKNLYTLAEIEARGYGPMALRYALISGHYRQPLNFTFESLNAAQSALDKLAAFSKKLLAAGASEASPTPPTAAAHWGPFEGVREALCDDLNTPKALGALFTQVNQHSPTSPQEAQNALEGLQTVLKAFGLTLPSQQAAEALAIPEEIQALAQKRWDAKAARDFKTADALRVELLAQGWEVQDTLESSVVVRK